MSKDGKTDHTIRCSFCAKGRNDVKTMIAGTASYICDECIELCNDIISEETDFNKDKEFEAGENLPTPQEIYDQLNEYVIGQDTAKKYLSVAVYNHYKRAFVNTAEKKRRRRRTSTVDESYFDLEKSNVMLLGPTGSGKTLLAKTLAKILDVPFAIADATSLTEAGYVGEDVESILLYLIQNADEDLSRASRGIVYIDEIDKIAKKSDGASTSRDVSGEGVQQALLKLIEGTIASVSPKGGRKHPHAESIKLDTNNILFICGGAFGGIEDMIANRLGTKKVGFANMAPGVEKPVDVRDLDENKIYEHVTSTDLVQYGLISEFIGRIPVITTLETLTEEALMKVLTEPKGSITQQYQKLFAIDDIKLTFTVKALRAVAHEAIERGTGARGLRAILENAMTDVMFKAPTDKENISEIIVDEGAISGESEPKIIYHDREEKTVKTS